MNTILEHSHFIERTKIPNHQRKLSDFRNEASILFDLSKCKCSDMVSNCKCAKAHTFPANERQFLQDQRRQRKMIIGGIDQKETSKLKRKAERQEANLKRMKKLKTDESKSQADSDVHVGGEDDT